jgi:drug/metabolite transporter (DMT)-like permease
MKQGSSAASGLAFAAAGFAILSIGDATAKTMAGQWPGTAIGLTRYIFGVVLLAVVLALVEGRKGFRIPHPGLQLLRGIGVSAGTFGVFMGVHVMSLADATAIVFTSPMLTALISAVFLGEKATRPVWISTILAFAGVLIVLRPEVARIGWAAGYPLIAAFGMATLMVVNRRVAGTASALSMQFLVALFAVPVLIVIALTGHASGLPVFHITMPDWTILARCAVIAVSGTVAHLLIYLATTRASAAVIAPMTYVQLLAATLYGFILFRSVPDAATYAGAALIISGGLYLWHSQRVVTVPEGTD